MLEIALYLAGTSVMGNPIMDPRHSSFLKKSFNVLIIFPEPAVFLAITGKQMPAPSIAHVIGSLSITWRSNVTMVKSKPWWQKDIETIQLLLAKFK